MGSETIKKMKDVNASLHRCLENWISDGGCNSKTEQKMQKYDKDELHEQSRSGRTWLMTFLGLRVRGSALSSQHPRARCCPTFFGGIE